MTRCHRFKTLSPSSSPISPKPMAVRAAPLLHNAAVATSPKTGLPKRGPGAASPILQSDRLDCSSRSSSIVGKGSGPSLPTWTRQVGLCRGALRATRERPPSVAKLTRQKSDSLERFPWANSALLPDEGDSRKFGTTSKSTKRGGTICLDPIHWALRSRTTGNAKTHSQQERWIVPLDRARDPFPERTRPANTKPHLLPSSTENISLRFVRFANLGVVSSPRRRSSHRSGRATSPSALAFDFEYLRRYWFHILKFFRALFLQTFPVSWTSRNGPSRLPRRPFAPACAWNSAGVSGFGETAGGPT